MLVQEFGRPAGLHQEGVGPDILEDRVRDLIAVSAADVHRDPRFDQRPIELLLDRLTRRARRSHPPARALVVCRHRGTAFLLGTNLLEVLQDIGVHDGRRSRRGRRLGGQGQRHGVGSTFRTGEVAHRLETRPAVPRGRLPGLIDRPLQEPFGCRIEGRGHGGGRSLALERGARQYLLAARG